MKTLFLICLLSVSITVFGQQETENYQIPIHQFEYNDVYSAAVKLRQGGKKLVRIYLYKTNINSGRAYSSKVAIGKIEVYDNKKGKGTPSTSVFDGFIYDDNGKLTVQIEYFKNSGIDILKLKKGAKLRLKNGPSNTVTFGIYGWGQIGNLGDFERNPRSNSYSEMIEGYYLQKIKDRIKNGKFSVSQIGKITATTANAEELLIASSLNVNYEDNHIKSNGSRAQNSNYYENLANKSEQTIRKAMKNAYVLKYMPKLNNINLFSDDKKHFEVSISRNNGNNFKYVVNRTQAYNTEIKTITRELVDKEQKARIKKEKDRQAQLLRQKEDYENQFKNAKAALNEAERISFEDYMTEKDMTKFIQYIYYDMFDKAHQHYESKSQGFSVIYVNYHISLNRQYPSHYENNKDYKFVDIGNASQARNIAINEKYIQSVKHRAQDTEINYSNPLSGYTLSQEISRINSEIKRLAKAFPPDSPIVLRLLENLHRFSAY